MRTIVVYSSLTGNTKKVGEAIASGLPAGTEAVSVKDVPILPTMTAYSSASGVTAARRIRRRQSFCRS
mgnify:CR=1 FL=1